MTQRLPALDGLRGWAAVIVSLHHGILFMAPATQTYLAVRIQDTDSVFAAISKLSLMIFNGNAAVIVFFVLSGRVLFGSLQRAGERPGSTILAFTAKRLCRLYPPFWVALVAYIGVFVGAAYLMPDLWVVYFTFKQVLINASLMSAPMFGASWTLSMELLAIPILLGADFMRRGLGNAGVLLLAALLMLLPPMLDPNAPRPIGVVAFLSTLGAKHVFLFALGALAGTEVGTRIGGTMKRIPAPALLGLLLLGVMFSPYRHFSVVICQGLLVFLLICKISNADAERDPMARLLSNPLSQYLGRISFSFYLLNPLALEILNRTAYRILPPHNDRHIELGIAIGIGASILTIIPARLMYKYVEIPTINAGRRIAGHLTGHVQGAESCAA
ncbi:MAG: acyltransferase [Azospirillaceae bacterium]|nr:acyltransferase [Azospirillaceae bacterium]